MYHETKGEMLEEKRATGELGLKPQAALTVGSILPRL